MSSLRCCLAALRCSAMACISNSEIWRCTNVRDASWS